jgi:transcriptional regulator
MYVPVFNALDDADEIRALVAAVGTAQVVTVGADGYPVATLLPVVWDGDVLLGHMARANPQWRDLPDDAPALAVVTGPQAYVSPSWYASKAEHGRVVPTWNYSAVHLTGRLRVHEDAEELHRLVTALTEQHEHGRAQPWAVTDAPADFVRRQLRAAGPRGRRRGPGRRAARRRAGGRRRDAPRGCPAAGHADDALSTIPPHPRDPRR